MLSETSNLSSSMILAISETVNFQYLLMLLQCLCAGVYY
jgi:hypothetical protein